MSLHWKGVRPIRTRTKVMLLGQSVRALRYQEPNKRFE
jgi:hypothetical protein